MGRLREHSYGGIIGDREYSHFLSQGYKGLAHTKTCFWIRTILQIFCIGFLLFLNAEKLRKIRQTWDQIEKRPGLSGGYHTPGLLLLTIIAHSTPGPRLLLVDPHTTGCTPDAHRANPSRGDWWGRGRRYRGWCAWIETGWSRWRPGWTCKLR